VLKDYTTGALVFCHVRPDFNKETHNAVIQAGFNDPQPLQVEDELNASAYEHLTSEFGDATTSVAASASNVSGQ